MEYLFVDTLLLCVFAHHSIWIIISAKPLQLILNQYVIKLILKLFEEEKTALSLSGLEQKFENEDMAIIFRTLKTFFENKIIIETLKKTETLKH